MAFLKRFASNVLLQKRVFLLLLWHINSGWNPAEIFEAYSPKLWRDTQTTCPSVGIKEMASKIFCGKHPCNPVTKANFRCYEIIQFGFTGFVTKQFDFSGLCGCCTSQPYFCLFWFTLGNLYFLQFLLRENWCDKGVTPLAYLQLLLLIHRFTIFRRNEKCPSRVCVGVISRLVLAHTVTSTALELKARMSPISLFSQLPICNRRVCKWAFIVAVLFPWCRKHVRKTYQKVGGRAKLIWTPVGSPKKEIVG